MEQRILSAAIEELGARGIRFTLDDVARRVGISKKTIYQYYASKDELFAKMVEATMADIERQECAIMERDLSFGERLRALITIEPQLTSKVSDHVKEDFRRFRPREWERMDEFYRKRIAALSEMLEQGMRNGDVRPLNSKIAARMLYGGIMEFCQYGSLKENNLTFMDALRAVTDVFLYGILKQ